MIDKRSKKFIKWLSGRSGHRFFYYDEYPDEFGDRDEFFAMVRFLNEKGLVETIKDQNGIHMGVRLSHVSIHRKEFSFMAVGEYLSDNWISLLALIISLLSFIGTYREELASIIQAITK